MKTKLFCAFLASSIIFTSCGGGSKPDANQQVQPEAEVVVEKPDLGPASVALVKDLKLNKERDGKQIELTGTFDPAMKAVVVDGKLDATFLVKGDGQRESITHVNVTFGQKANNLYFPVNFRDVDLEIYDKDGSKLAYNTKITITGTVKYTSKSKTDFSFALKDVVITKAE